MNREFSLISNKSNLSEMILTFHNETLTSRHQNINIKCVFKVKTIYYKTNCKHTHIFIQKYKGSKRNSQKY